jgi:hypothetical protein
MVHVKLVLPEEPPLVAVAVTEYVPAVVGVPLMTPVAAFRARPAGRPVADQV